jgi:hypothetical protein
MKHEQFSLSLEDIPEAPLTQEEILLWDEGKRNATYKEKVGVNPRVGKSPEQITYGILNPEKERASLEAEDRRDDKQDVQSTYRR